MQRKMIFKDQNFTKDSEHMYSECVFRSCTFVDDSVFYCGNCRFETCTLTAPVDLVLCTLDTCKVPYTFFNNVIVGTTITDCSYVSGV